MFRLFKYFFKLISVEMWNSNDQQQSMCIPVCACVLQKLREKTKEKYKHRYLLPGSNAGGDGSTGVGIL